MTTSEKIAEILLKIGAVSLNAIKPFKYVSGILSPVYTDCRVLMSFPKERRIIRDLYVELIKSAGQFDVIAGTATAGIPHAAWVAEKLNLPMIYVRGSAKDHGKGNQIEGKLYKNQKVAIIEDLISTGESSCETARAIKKAGGKTNYIFAITTYGMEKAQQNFKKNKLKILTLTDFATTVKVAENLGLIKDAERNIILAWTKDPPNWGQQMGFEK